MRPYPTPDPRIAAYVAEIRAPGIPYVSTSHLTLRRLNDEFGQAVVSALIAVHFAECRRWDYDKNMTYEGYCERRKACGFTIQYGPHEWAAYVASKDYPEFQG